MECWVHTDTFQYDYFGKANLKAIKNCNADTMFLLGGETRQT